MLKIHILYVHQGLVLFGRKAYNMLVTVFYHYQTPFHYNVVADSTSQAAAKYSGYISSHDYIDLNSGLIFSPDYSEMVSDNDKKQLRAYYMLYDQTRPDPDEHTK